jgi:hypothetical protein
MARLLLHRGAIDRRERRCQWTNESAVVLRHQHQVVGLLAAIPTSSVLGTVFERLAPLFLLVGHLNLFLALEQAEPHGLNTT